jgi:DNA-binding GntR family transcriptional regulator
MDAPAPAGKQRSAGATGMSPVQNRRDLLSRDSVKNRLVELIDSGEIRFDAALSERALAERMGISRTPVREALQDLARDGILTVHPARGAFLNTIGLDEMRSLYEVRLGLEGVAAYRAAATGRHEELAGLREGFAALDNQPPTPEFLRRAQDLGDAFHLAMFKAAGNQYLLSLYDRLRLKIRISLRMTREHYPDRVIQTVEEHRAVLQAILDREPTTAQQAIDRHLRNGFEARVRIYAELPHFKISNNLDQQ